MTEKMKHSAKILADSVNPAGVRLVTMEVIFPRIVLCEFNTHRALSKSSASSRAIPVEVMIRAAMENPYIPSEWPANGKGMSASENIPAGNVGNARFEWLDCRDCAVDGARQLHALGVHKQITNRLLEPFMWHTMIVSATEWENFFKLRCAPDAHPEIRCVAELMRDALAASKPVKRDWREWHLPLVTDEERASGDFDAEELAAISAGRCARVSYLTHDGRRDPGEDDKLFRRLCKSGHYSPMEHVAMAMRTQPHQRSNFDFPTEMSGWLQLRKIEGG